MAEVKAEGVKPKPKLKLEVHRGAGDASVREIIVEARGKTPARIRKILKRWGFEYIPLMWIWVAGPFTASEYKRFVEELSQHAELEIEEVRDQWVGSRTR